MKFNNPKEVIQYISDKFPIITYKSTEIEIKEVARKTTELLYKHFSKTHDIQEQIGGAEDKPPFSLSWIIKEKVKTRRKKTK